MRNKNKRIKRIIALVVVLCSLCSVFAVCVSAEEMQTEAHTEMQTEAQTESLAVNNQNADYLTIWTPELFEVDCSVDGWYSYGSVGTFSAENCLLDVVWHNGSMCYRIAPIDYTQTARITIPCSNAILDSQHRKISIIGEYVGDSATVVLNGSGSYYAEVSGLGGMMMPYTCNGTSNLLNGSYSLHTVPMLNTSYDVTLGNISITLTASDGGVLYVKALGIGGTENSTLSVESYRKYDNVLPVQVKSVNDDNLWTYTKFFDFSMDTINLTDIFDEVFVLYNEFGMLEDYVDVRLCFDGFNSGLDGFALRNVFDMSEKGFGYLEEWLCTYDFVLCNGVRERASWYGGEFVNGEWSSTLFPYSGIRFLGVDDNNNFDYVSICYDVLDYDYIQAEYHYYNSPYDIVLYKYRKNSVWIEFIENNGYSGGYSDGYGDGYDEGDYDGYYNGYSDGLVDGESNGFEIGYQSGCDDGYDIGYDTGYYLGLENGYDNGYGNGYGSGYVDGNNDGYDNGFDDGYDLGVVEGGEVSYSKGYADGYNIGFANGDAYEGQNFNDLIITSAKSVGATITAMFNWEFLGVNILSIIGSLLFVGIALIVLKYVL